MKRLISIFTVFAVLYTFYVGVSACEPVVTPGDEAMGYKLGNATVTIDGIPTSFSGNCITDIGYHEVNKTRIIENSYDEVSFYMQLSPNSSTDEAVLRVILNKFDNGNTDKILKQNGNIYTLKRGEDAQKVVLPFKDYENLYMIFATAGGSIIVADINFTNYVPMAPKAKVTETDVASLDGNVVSTAEVEFSQKMRTDVSLDDFSVEGSEAIVKSVSFDESGKKATLTFSQLFDFETEYMLNISENVINDCDKCEFAVDEEYRHIPMTFHQPAPIVIGEGHFMSNGSEIENVINGKVSYVVPVKNKYDLTENGREFTLMVMMYNAGILKSVKYDNIKLLPGEKADLSAEVNVVNEAETEVYAFLWDNPIDMNAFDDMQCLMPISQ